MRWLATVQRIRRPPYRFDPLAQASHWLMAGLVIYLMVDGARLSAMGLTERKQALQSHAGLGLVALILAGAAVCRRLRRSTPAYPPTMSTGEKRVAKTVVWALYGFAVVQPVAGLLHAATYVDFDVVAIGALNLTVLLPSDGEITTLFHSLHALGFFALYLLIALHVAAALKHALIDDDDIPWRMMPMRLARPLQRVAGHL